MAPDHAQLLQLCDAVLVHVAAGVEAPAVGDSTFLNLLLYTHALTQLRVAGPSVQVRRLLEVTGTDQVLHLYPDLTTALKA